MSIAGSQNIRLRSIHGVTSHATPTSMNDTTETSESRRSTPLALFTIRNAGHGPAGHSAALEPTVARPRAQPAASPGDTPPIVANRRAMPAGTWSTTPRSGW